MVSPKEKVRANIYKSLLEEEKRRNKKMSVFSLSLFVVGIFTGTSYNSLKESMIGEQEIQQVVALNSSENTVKGMENKDFNKMIDELFQVNEIKIDKRDFNSENLFVTELKI